MFYHSIFISIKRIIFFIILLGGVSSAAEASPVIFFSDMTDGPTSGWNGSTSQGAALSIWGQNFGTSGTVTVTNSASGTSVNIPSSTCAEWAATTNPTTARGLQRITFWLSSDMGTSGTAPNSTIEVTTSDGTSNTIPFHCRTIGSNHIYFFDDDGSDSAGDGSLSSPWKTGEKARAVLKAGDIGYFREGSYTSIDTQYTGFGAFMYLRSDSPNHNNGSEYNTITITSYPAEQAQIGAYGDNSVLLFFRHNYGTISYWTISKFKSVAMRSAVKMAYDASSGDRNIRFVGNDFTSTVARTGTGFILDLQAGGSGSEGMKLYGNYLNRGGRPLAPAIAPTISAGTGTGITGSYNAKYLFARINGDRDKCYSDLSPAASNAVQLNNGALRVSWPEAYTYDASYPFTHVLIYRTKAGGSTYYYDQTVSYSGAGYVDTTTADSSLGSEEVPYGYKVESMYVQGFGDITDIEIAWNEIAYCNGPGQFYGHLTTDELTLLKFHNNYVHHGGSQLVFGGGDGSSAYTFIKTAYIYNNIIANMNSATRMAYPSGGGWHGGDYYVYNNIFYDCGSSYSFIVVGPSVYEMKNNIVYSLASSGDYFTYEIAGITGDAPGSCSGDHNLWYGPGAGPTWSDTGDYDDVHPVFTGAELTSLTDFLPTESSPTRGKGAVLSYGQDWDTYDFYGVVRGDTWDIGAFEYGTSVIGSETVDVLLPTVNILTPTNLTSYDTNSSTVSIGGTASDNAGVSSVTWTNSRGGSGIASGTTNWSANIPLVNGENQITITVQDTSDNISSDSITVNCDIVAPDIPSGIDATIINN